MYRHHDQFDTTIANVSLYSFPQLSTFSSTMLGVLATCSFLELQNLEGPAGSHTGQFGMVKPAMSLCSNQHSSRQFKGKKISQLQQGTIRKKGLLLIFKTKCQFCHPVVTVSLDHCLTTELHVQENIRGKTFKNIGFMHQTVAYTHQLCSCQI